jgi:hypothetical protein
MPEPAGLEPVHDQVQVLGALVAGRVDVLGAVDAREHGDDSSVTRFSSS